MGFAVGELLVREGDARKQEIAGIQPLHHGYGHCYGLDHVHGYGRFSPPRTVFPSGPAPLNVRPRISKRDKGSSSFDGWQQPRVSARHSSPRIPERYAITTKQAVPSRPTHALTS